MVEKFAQIRNNMLFFYFGHKGHKNYTENFQDKKRKSVEEYWSRHIPNAGHLLLTDRCHHKGSYFPQGKYLFSLWNMTKKYEASMKHVHRHTQGTVILCFNIIPYSFSSWFSNPGEIIDRKNSYVKAWWKITAAHHEGVAAICQYLGFHFM